MKRWKRLAVSCRAWRVLSSCPPATTSAAVPSALHHVGAATPNRAHHPVYLLRACGGVRTFHSGTSEEPTPQSLLFMSTHTESDQKEDYYKTLGVPRNASQKEIKKAYYEVSWQKNIILTEMKEIQMQPNSSPRSERPMR
ncbi:DnaJ homolog subfamily A member 3, mitochondrial, partial [Geodia barretti]